MKRILLICTVLVSSFAFSNAHGQTSMFTPASKTDYSKKVNDYNSLASLGKTVNAKLAMDTICQMMESQMRYCKYKIHDGIATGDTTATRLAKKNMMDKWDLYNNMSNYLNDVVKNQTTINTYLSSFYAIMD